MRTIHEGNRVVDPHTTWVKTCTCRAPSVMGELSLRTEESGDRARIMATYEPAPKCTKCGAVWRLEP